MGTALRTVGGRYALEATLGQGGMGRVFKARHLELGKVFALKVIAPAFAGDEAARARFNQEAKLASEISHPNLVSVVDFGEDPQLGAYMVMELVEGTPLLDVCAPPTSLKRALDVMGQLADVLDHVHRCGVVHGDIKAENVLLVTEPDGMRRRQVVRLIDFGLATRRGTRCEAGGTAEYAAPECVQGAPPSVASDVYALGVLGFLMLTGRYPFDGNVLDVLTAQIEKPPPTVADVRGEPVAASIEHLIARALAKNPDERHKSAAALRYELNAVMDMLAMERRRTKGSSMLRPTTAREATIQRLFEGSPLPQALISPSGAIGIANRAFDQLVATGGVPDLMDAVATVLEHGTPVEVRARTAGGELVAWVTPFAPDAVHVVMRVDAIAS